MGGKEMLLFYSKGPCLGKCPVYDLAIYTDGTVRYKGVSKVDKKGVFEYQLSSETIGELTLLLENSLTVPIAFRRIRDIPVTTLKFRGKKYKFHASRAENRLKAVNTKVEDLIRQLNIHPY